VTDETIGDKDPLLARLLAAATAGAPPAGPANKRKPLRIVLDPDAHPVAKGNLCGQHRGFNLHGATKVAANDKQGRLALCKYVLRPPLANDRLAIIDADHVRLDFKKPWSDGTTSVEIAPLALIARLAALVPPPRRHLTGYFGVLSSHSSHRSQCVPAPVPEATPEQEDKSSRTLPLSHYISWSELLRRTFEIDTICPRCKSPLRLVALIKTDDTIKKILSAMGLPTEAPKPYPARPPPSEPGGEGGDWLN
jgi:Putative transposase